jgi:anthranilate synthase component 1
LLPINFQKKGRLFNLTDEEFKHNVALAKNIVFGDVFQLVLSRRFTQGFKGEFNVYRALIINPSLFIFLTGFQIFGSSPEAQIIVKDRKAEILSPEL